MGANVLVVGVKGYVQPDPANIVPDPYKNAPNKCTPS